MQKHTPKDPLLEQVDRAVARLGRHYSWFDDRESEAGLAVIEKWMAGERDPDQLAKAARTRVQAAARREQRRGRVVIHGQVVAVKPINDLVPVDGFEEPTLNSICVRQLADRLRRERSAGWPYLEWVMGFRDDLTPEQRQRGASTVRWARQRSEIREMFYAA